MSDIQNQEQQPIIQDNAGQQPAEQASINQDNQQSDNIIKGNEYVLLIDNRDNRKIVNLKENKKTKWRKKMINMKDIVGKEFNVVYEYSNDKIVYDPNNFNQFYNYEENYEEEQAEQRDNRNIFNDNSVQKLSNEAIELMKKDETISKEELIKIIQENNDKFNQRTAFSKEKYLQRKKEKYFFYFTVLKTTPLNVVETLYLENPKLVNYMRGDAFSMFMHYANIREGSNIALFDNTKGAILGGAVIRLNGKGKIHYMKEKMPFNQITCYSQMNVPQHLNSSVEFRNPNQVAEAKTDKFTHLLIVGDFDVTEIVEKFMHLLVPNGVLLAYSNYLECLQNSFDLMQQERDFVNIKIFDIFYREHQVLKNRTHPITMMSPYSGYILTGYKII
ncbi:hypothetical protein ABPG74_021528 [Tetrahymena malaccensis]